MLTRPVKLPLAESFAWLCGFIGTLRSGLEMLSTDKHDINAAVDFTIPVSGWGTDNSVPSHPHYIDIAVNGMLASDIVAVNVAPVSVPAAREANFTNTQSYVGKFRLRAKCVPTEAITAQYHITNTAAYSVSGADSGETEG